MTTIRRAYVIQGQVQGVGFRPFVWRLATSLGLSGFVYNAPQGVCLEVQGSTAKIEDFKSRLLAELPPLAEITRCDAHDLPLDKDEGKFVIKASAGGASSEILVSADVAVCEECLTDIRDPANRRFGYAFTNCVNCGPRFSITDNLPYDRQETVMRCFALCPECAKEYANPADRRFHAQPIACPICGPRLWFTDGRNENSGKFTPENQPDAIAWAAELLKSGKILALKGLGGFQLVCDARNAGAVSLLRQRKNRPHKALAVMAHTLEDVNLFCQPSLFAQKLLAGREKPVTLCPAAKNAPMPLVESINPDSPFIGVMLPYTPLHALLLDYLAAHGLEHPALVMTSANPAGEPICLGNREALARLASLADGWLLHDRDILCRVDDSVVAAPVLPDENSHASAVFIRRARGYTPAPVRLADGLAGYVLGTGAELKTTLCLTRGHDAFVGQHVGDLKSPQIFGFYQESLAHLQKLLKTTPQAVVCDLHPDFISSQFAADFASTHKLPLWKLQHHAAHAAAVLAENGVFTPALALCLDGFGLGPAGELWGGELLRMDLSRAAWEKLGGLREIPLPGGERATSEPWRIARALCFLGGHDKSLSQVSGRSARIIDEMIAARLNCPPSSSCGRLFDGVASLLGLCDCITYEGQAPMILEKKAWEWLGTHSLASLSCPSCKVETSENRNLLDFMPLVGFLQENMQKNMDIAWAAAIFHVGLAKGLVELCRVASEKSGILQIGLTGGVMQNGLMSLILPQFLKDAGLVPLVHQKLPPGDGSISFGQAVWGRALLSSSWI